MNTENREDILTLEILQTIQQRSNVTQRHLASRLGVALGLANSYLKRCVRKGLIKVEQAPANRYLYYLTPRGFSEKSRLTGEYLRSSFDFYRRAGIAASRIFRLCRDQGRTRIVLFGVSELAEIAILRATEAGVRICAVVDHTVERKRFHGIPVFTELPQPGEYDACVITDIRDPAGSLAVLQRQLPAERIYAPEILGIQVEN